MKGSILVLELLQSCEYLRQVIGWIRHGFRGVVREEGERAKRKVNKLLRTKEESELQGYYKDVVDKHKSATKTNS